MSYILEYAKSNKSSCSGRKTSCPSKTYSIAKGELRLGVEVPNMHGTKWRHWACVTPTVIGNMQQAFANPDQITGWQSLRPDDQERVQRAWDEGEIPANEIPEPAPEHIQPATKKKNTTSLPATNEVAATSSSSSKKGTSKTKVAKGDEPKSSDGNKDNAGEEEAEFSQKKSTKSGSRKSSRAIDNNEPTAAATKKIKTEPAEVYNTKDDSPPATKPTTSKASKNTDEPSTSKASKNTDEPSTSKAARTKKVQTTPDEPKVASFATRNKSVKTTETKSKGEPTRHSLRISALKKEESNPDINAKKPTTSATKKRAVGNENGVTKKARRN